MRRIREEYVLTKNELKLREKIVLTAYEQGNHAKAANYLMELIEQKSISKLYRFRPPCNREINSLESLQIYLSKAKNFEDKEDCIWLIDIQEVINDCINRKKINEHKIWGYIEDDARKMINDYISLSKKISDRLMEIKSNVRDMCLIACMTDKKSEYMWNNYAKEKQGICLEYDMLDVLEAIKKENLKLIPVWYVDNRLKEKRIIFGSKEYREDYSDLLMLRKYILSCVTKNKIPYAKESEWRLMSEDGGLLTNDDGKLFDFAIPKRIILGENIDYNIEFKYGVCRVANQLGIEIASE